MKKITLFFVMLLIGFSGYSQYENFDDPSVANPTGLGPWILPSGTWQILQSGTGTVKWALNTTDEGTYPAYSAPRAAFIDRENLGPIGNSSQDYLVTPAWAVPENPELHFWTRTTVAINYGTIYKIKACLGTDDPTNIASYTTTLASWTEVSLTEDFEEYQEKIVDVSEFPTGTVIHLAFVKEFEQTMLEPPGPKGDRWLVDEVRLVSKCLDPLNLTAASLSASAVLSWDSPGPATSWNVWVLPQGTPFVPANLSPPFIAGDLGTGSNEGFTVTQTSELTPAAMVPVTEYVYYVQANCGSYTSTIVTSDVFTTQALPPECGGNFVDNGGPAGDYTGGAPEIITICPPAGSGQIVVVTFTDFNTAQNNDGLYVYDGMSVNAPMIASDNGPGWSDNVMTPGAFWGTEIPGPFDASNPEGCLTFQFVSQSWSSREGWIANITCIPAPTCPKPAGLTAISATDASVTLTWTSITEPANGFELLATPCGSGAPAVDAVGLPFVPESGDTSPYTFTYPGLAQNTCFDFWVRAKCSTTDTSLWSIKERFSTQLAPPLCGGQYKDQGGLPSEEQNGNYFSNEDSIVTICPEAGQIVIVTFASFAIQEIYDGMLVYDGNSILSPQIESENEAADYGTFEDRPGAYWGDEIPAPFEASNALGCLTFRFLSDDYDERAGWVANVTCVPAPTCQKPTALTVVSTTQTEATVSWTAVGSATSYNVYAIPCGDPAPIGGVTTPWAVVNDPATDVTTTLTGLDPATCYKIYVISICTGDDFSNPTSPKQAVTQVLPPVCGGFFYDATGPLDYQADTHSTVTICPDDANPDDFVTVIFTEFGIERNYDGMYIFDGPDTDSPLIPSDNESGYDYPELSQPGAYWGNVSPGQFTSTDPSGCLTFVFTSSEYSGRDKGWEGTVLCGPTPTCPQPTGLATGVPTDTAIPVTWTSAGSATEWHVYAVPCGSAVPAFGDPGFQVATAAQGSSAEPFLFANLDPVTCYQMYVYAVCSETDHSPIPAGPATDFTQVVPPNCGDEFKDVGGNENYPSDVDSVVIICPDVPGQVVTVQFTEFDVSSGSDGLYIYDGSGTAGTQILSDNGTGYSEVTNEIPGAFWGMELPGTYESSAIDGCLTFHFVSSEYSGYNAGWSANVTCGPAPACPRPTAVNITEITETSAIVSWTAVGTPSSFEVLILPLNSDDPDDNTTGWQAAAASPITIEGLTSGTLYKVYVRAICSDTEKSDWSYPDRFNTLISNDDCEDATVVDVNPGTECITFANGLLIDATDSGTPGCYGNTVNDVWFSFTAAVSNHFISVGNISNGDLQYGLYSGSCGEFSLITCHDSYEGGIVTSDLIPGETYYLQVYSPYNLEATTSFTVCIGTLETPIITSTDVGEMQDFVFDWLLDSPCGTVTNVTSLTGIDFEGETANGIGTFLKNGSSFPFEKGIVLSTTSALLAPGPNANSIGDSYDWEGDDELEQIIFDATGYVMDSYNATILEFDFVPETPQFAFDYLFASDEYGTFQCDYSDSFAFLLTDVTAGGSTINMAVLEGTTTPVSVITIRNSLFNDQCESVNPELFDEYYENVLGGSEPLGAPVNFNGATVPMVASATVIPGNTYHIKLVIADRGDPGFNSAVFIHPRDFGTNTVDLGEDFLAANGTALCVGSSFTLSTGISPDDYNFAWTKDGLPLTAETGDSIIVTETAVYGVTATYGTSECTTYDEVTIEFYTPTADVLTDVQVCATVGYTLPALSENNHYFTGENCSGTELMPGDVIMSPQTIFICKIVDSCSGSSNFVVDVFENPVVTIAGDCQGASYVLDATVTNPLTDGAYTYMWATEGGEIISGGDTASATVSGAGTYTVTVVLSVVNCEGEAQELVTSTSCTIQKGISVNGDGKNDVFDLSDFEVAKLEIYNRYGLKVYERKEYSNQWGGQSDKGDELPDGTYYYVIERKGGQPTVTGWIYINREN